MNKGRKENAKLRAFIQEHWKQMTDQMIATKHDCSHVKVRAMRRTLGLKRDKVMLNAMYSAHRQGKVYIAREPIRLIRQGNA